MSHLAADDSSPETLALRQGRFGPIWYCHAGCDPADVRDALLAAGILKPQDPHAARTTGRRQNTRKHPDWIARAWRDAKPITDTPAAAYPTATPPDISRRDYFAGLAMHALLRNRNVPANTGALRDSATEDLAKAAWDVADVMLEQDERREFKAAASLAGLAPVTRESGTWKGRSFIRGGRSRPRRMLYMAAVSASTHNPDLARKYRELRDRGKPPKVALTAALRKLVVLANALLKQDREWTPEPVGATG